MPLLISWFFSSSFFFLAPWQKTVQVGKQKKKVLYFNEVNKKCFLTHGLSLQGFRRWADEAGRYVPKQAEFWSLQMFTDMSDAVVSSTCDFRSVPADRKAVSVQNALQERPRRRWVYPRRHRVFLLLSGCRLLLSNVWSLCLSAGWQSLIDDTIKNLQQVGGAVKDSVIVRRRFPLHKYFHPHQMLKC